jgi:ribosomal protein S18 acetylase RimI-like enzyme
MKITKEFDGEKITIREISSRDLVKVREFQDYINSLVEEDAQILINKRISLKEEKQWLKKEIEEVRKKRRIMMIAEHMDRIIGICDVWLRKGRENHVAEIGLSVRKEYRGIGLGKFLMETALKVAKDKLRPRIFRLSVASTNKIAQNLYKKLKFKEVARIPEQLKYKGKFVDEIVMIREA